MTSEIEYDPKTFTTENDHLKLVKYMVNSGCDLRDDDNYAIKVASYNAHWEVVKYLFEVGCFCMGCDREVCIKVLGECKNKLLVFMQTVKNNKYLKMEILKVMFPQFSEYELFLTIKN
jgi:hypothetical protein